MKILTQSEKAAKWAAGLKYEHIPGIVITRAKLQILDCLAAIMAGHRSDSGLKINSALDNLYEHDGGYTVIPSNQLWPLDAAVYYHSALINSIELDNFHFMGHLSESTFPTAFSIAERYNLTGRDLLKAMIGAQEITGRFGAYIATGPQQGHMRSYLHRTGGVITTGILLDCPENVISKAISIALSMPEFSLYPASYSPETKVICTSSPTVAGIYSTYLAMEGFDGTLDIIENPMGFLTYFSYGKYKPDIWKYLGDSWLTNTISSKEYATCGYAQGPVQAASRLISDYGELDPDEIAGIRIDAPLTTVVMENFSRPHYGSFLTPVNINFSTRRSVTVTLIYGAPTGYFYRAGNLKDKTRRIEELANKCILNHSWDMTIAMGKGFDKGLVGGGKPGVLSMSSAGTSLSKFNKAFGSQKLFQLNELHKILSLKSKDKRYLARRYWRSIRPYFPFLNSQERINYHSYEGNLDNLEFILQGRVVVKLKNGKSIEGYCSQPSGFAGSEIREKTIIGKYYRETVPVWGEAKSVFIKNMIDRLEEIKVRDLILAIKMES